MKTLLSICSSILFFLDPALGQNAAKKFSLSWEANFGVVNGNLMNAPVQMGWCFECIALVLYQNPKIGVTFGGGAEFGLGKRSALNLGIQISEFRFQHNFIERSLFFSAPLDNIKSVEVLNRYRGWQLLYKYKLLTGKKISFSLQNGLLYEKFKGSNEDERYIQFGMKKHGISYLTKAEIAFQVRKGNFLTLSPFFRVALKSYNETYDYFDKYLPKGMGLMLGWRTQVIGL